MRCVRAAHIRPLKEADKDRVMPDGESIQDDAAKAAATPGPVEDRVGSRKVALAEIHALRRPLPPGFKFDREEANER